MYRAGFTLLCIFVTAATQKVRLDGDGMKGEASMLGLMMVIVLLLDWQLYGSPVYDPVVLVSRLESRVLQVRAVGSAKVDGGVGQSRWRR